jgi:hypothetical protein
MNIPVPAVARAAAIALLSLGAAACSVTATPDRPIVPGCGPDDSVPCNHGAGYSCSPGDDPENSDSSLVCSDGVDADGATLYCCVTYASGSSCAPDDTVQGCTGYSYGFSCTGSDRPDDTDSSLVCSDATPAGGALLYCCTD